MLPPTFHDLPTPLYTVYFGVGDDKPQIYTQAPSQALPSKWLREEPKVANYSPCHVISSLVMCASPTSPYNGEVTITTLSLGATATYSCNCGFELIGAVRATCTMMEGEDKPTFVPAAPTCRGTCSKFCMHIWENQHCS